MGLSEQLKSSSARTPALILAVLVLLGLGLATVAAFQSGDPEAVSSQVVRAAPPASSTTTSTTLDPAAATSTTIAPAAAVPTVTSAPTIGPTPTAAPTTAAPVPVTTAPPPTVPPTSDQCTPAQADQTLTTDKATYAAGELVTVTATVRNHSASSCAVADPNSGCYILFTAYLPPDPNAYWRSGSVPGGPCQPLRRRTLFPGAVATYSAVWDQSDRRGCRPDNTDPGCSKPRVPGLYTIQSGWLSEFKTALVTLA